MRRPDERIENRRHCFIVCSPKWEKAEVAAVPLPPIRKGFEWLCECGHFFRTRPVHPPASRSTAMPIKSASAAQTGAQGTSSKTAQEEVRHLLPPSPERPSRSTMPWRATHRRMMCMIPVYRAWSQAAWRGSTPPPLHVSFFVTPRSFVIIYFVPCHYICAYYVTL